MNGQYTRYPALRVPTYPNAGSFPATGNVNGNLVVDLSTSTLYEFNGTSFVAIATPGAAIAIDGLMGDVVASGPGVVTATIQPGVVSNSKLADMPNNTVKANKSGGISSPSDLALSSVTETISSVLTITNGANTVVSPAALTIQVTQSGAGSSGYLSYTDWNTFNNKQASGSYITALTGDVGASGPGSATATINFVGGKTAAQVATTVTNNTTDVTIGTANGLSLVGQVLSFQPAAETHAGIYYHYPVDAGVVEQDIVMNIVDNNTSQAPLFFKKAVNNGDSYYPAIYGVAKNVSGGFADIWIGKNYVVPGFSFGAFIGVDYYLDGATPGGLTYTPPAVGSGVNPIKVGRALDATHLILDPIGNFVQAKGGLYTSDGSYDEVLPVGTNGNVLVANSAATDGLTWAPAVVASAPFTYTPSTRTLTIATATNSVSGVLSAADHTTFSAKQSATLTSAHILVGNASNVATDVAMSGDVSITNTGATSISAATVTGKLITGYVSGAGVVAATDTILQAIDKLNGNAALLAPKASPVFTGDVNSSTGNVLISTIGKGLQVKTGANAKIGTAVLSAGTVTVANTSVTANSRIFLTSNTDGGTPGWLRVSAKTAATSFVITSSSILDTSTVAWIIVESIP